MRVIERRVRRERARAHDERRFGPRPGLLLVHSISESGKESSRCPYGHLAPRHSSAMRPHLPYHRHRAFSVPQDSSLWSLAPLRFCSPVPTRRTGCVCNPAPAVLSACGRGIQDWPSRTARQVLDATSLTAGWPAITPGRTSYHSGLDATAPTASWPARTPQARRSSCP